MVSSGGRVRRSGSGKFASLLPSGGRGFDLMAGKTNNVAPATVTVGASSLTTVSVVNLASGIADKAGGTSVELQNDQPAKSKPLKEKTSNAERHALQESQRAAKPAAKGIISTLVSLPNL